jgi:hypothetical protein
MTRERATAGVSANTLAGEAWAAGCRDVQAAINWATARGQVAGRPFQAAFRQAMAAQDASPPDVNSPNSSADVHGKEAVAGVSKRARHSDPAPAKPAGRARQKVIGAEAGANGQAGHPTSTPTPAAEAVSPPAGNAIAPAEFVADLKELRRLVTKYGKKGLADLVGLLGG